MSNKTKSSNDTDQLRLSGGRCDNVGNNQITGDIDKSKTGEPLAASALLGKILVFQKALKLSHQATEEHLLSEMEQNPIYQQSLKEALAVNAAYQKVVQPQSPSQPK